MKQLDDLRDVLRRDIAAGMSASDKLSEQLGKIDAQLEACRQDRAEYAAMARAALG